MIHAVIPMPLPSYAVLVTTATRVWRAARTAGDSTQNRLYDLLAPLDMGLLAPAFDSLMTLCEAAFGRPIQVNGATALSFDEDLLLGLIEGTQSRRACIRCDAGTATALDCAICSTRILLRLAITGRG
jgi:hypothetical protein